MIKIVILALVVTIVIPITQMTIADLIPVLIEGPQIYIGMYNFVFILGGIIIGAILKYIIPLTNK